MAGVWNIVIPQGAYWERPLTIEDDGVLRPLTGYTARMQIRDTHDGASSLIELTTANGGIVLTDPGVVTLILTAVQTAALPRYWRGVYDLELVPPDGKVDRLLEGEVRISAEVTR
jgi:hypothetical protein